MKRVLITGATGFLGSNLAYKLHSMGFEVTASGRDILKAKNLELKGIKFHQLDLSQKISFKNLSKNFDWVFHCAALSSPWGPYKDFYDANVTATQNLLDHFSASNVERFIYVSSPSIYTDLKSKTQITENSKIPEINLNHYIKTKKICEQLVDRFTADSKIPIITIRPQGIIGDGDPSIFPRILKTAQKGFLPKIGNGSTTLDLTYIDNVVHSLICAAKADTKCVGKKYNITNDEPIELYTTLAKVFSELNVKFKWKSMSIKKAMFIGHTLEKIYSWLPKIFEPPLTRYTVCTFAYDRTLDISKAKAELNYKPIVPMHTALDICISSMQKDLKNG